MLKRQSKATDASDFVAANRTRAETKPKKKSKRQGPGIEKVRETIERAVEVAKDGPLPPSEKAGWLLVGLWAFAFSKHYDVDVAPDVTKTEWLAASSAAQRLINTQFGGDIDRAIEFVVWTWERQIDRGKRNRDGSKRAPLGWRLQFSPALVTEFRVDTMGD